MLRVLVCLGLAALLMWALYEWAPIPFWMKVLLDVTLVGGLLAALGLGPWTYRQHQEHLTRTARLPSAMWERR